VLRPSSCQASNFDVDFFIFFHHFHFRGPKFPKHWKTPKCYRKKFEFTLTKAKNYERVEISFDSMLMAFLSWHCRCKYNLTDHHCFCSKLKTNILHSQKSCFIRIVSSSGAFTLAKFNSKHSVYNSTASFYTVHKWPFGNQHRKTIKSVACTINVWRS
jgi:hypothetical protein